MSKVDPKVILVNLSSFFRFFDEDETRGKIFGRKIRGVAQSPLEKRVRATIMDKRGVIRISRPFARTCSHLHYAPAPLFMGIRGQATYYADDGPRNKNDKGPILLFSLATVKTVDEERNKKKKRRDCKRRNERHLQESLRRNSVCFYGIDKSESLRDGQTISQIKTCFFYGTIFG